ncbi:MAG: DUF2243 domain-containing protein [Thermomicrobiales bacterium]
MADEQAGRPDPRSALWASIPLGIGLVGAVDEIVFHQLLQWHAFYVDASQRWRVFSDGLLHAFTLSMLFYGAYRLWRERQSFSQIVSSKPFWSGVLIGGGGFHLWDGIVDHKLLRLHPIREGVDNILIYDIAWNAAALLLLALGWAIWRSGVMPELVVQPARPNSLTE